MGRRNAASRSKPVRVLYTEGNVDGTIGGSYYSLLYLLEGLKGTRYNPSVVFHRDHAMLSRFAAVSDRAHVVQLRGVVSLLGGAGSFQRRHAALRIPAQAVQRGLNLGGFSATILQYVRLLRRWRIDLLHLNNSVTSAHEWMLAGLITKTPYVVHERGMREQFPFPTKPLARRSAAVICISNAVRRNLIEHDVTQDNLVLIENGLDPARFTPVRSGQAVRSELGICQGQRVIGLVGNIREWKGQEVLVRALPAIVKRFPDLVCLFVGASTEWDGSYTDLLQRLISQDGLQENVRFTGYRENVADYINVMDLTIHASILPEPFGRVALEAMALRKPVVCSRAGGMPEIVRHGVTGYTFAPSHAEELASLVIELLEHPAAARAMGEAGFARLSSKFHVSLNIERTLSLYDELLGFESPTARASARASTVA